MREWPNSRFPKPFSGISRLIDEASLVSIKLTGEEDLISEHRQAIEVGECVEGAKLRTNFHEPGDFHYRTIGLPPSAPNFPSHNTLSIPLKCCPFP